MVASLLFSAGLVQSTMQIPFSIYKPSKFLCATQMTGLLSQHDGHIWSNYTSLSWGKPVFIQQMRFFYAFEHISLKETNDNYFPSVKENRMTISVNRLFSRLQRCVKALWQQFTSCHLLMVLIHVNWPKSNSRLFSLLTSRDISLHSYSIQLCINTGNF